MFSESSSLEYFNVDNSEATDWPEITNIVSRLLQNSLQLVPMAEWINEVAKRAGDGPAASLRDFLARLPHEKPLAFLQVTKSLALCPALGYGPITSPLMSRYLTSLEIPVSGD